MLHSLVDSACPSLVAEQWMIIASIVFMIEFFFVHLSI